MNHRVFGRKLHRNKKERAQLFKVLVHNFVAHGKLVTTEAKAKAVRPFLEKLVTKAKKGETQRPLLLKETGGDKEVVNGLFQKAGIFSQVPGGYTKLIKLPARRGDNGRQLLIIWSREENVGEIKKESMVRKSPETKLAAPKLSDGESSPKVKRARKAKKK